MIRSSGAYLGGRSGIYPVGGGSNTDPDAQAVINQMTSNGSTPSEARQTLINQLVLDLKGIGNTGVANVWGDLDVLQIYAAEDSTQALTEWKVADGTLDAINVNGSTFTADSGFTGTGTSYINTSFNPTASGSNYTLNACSFGTYLNASAGYIYVLGANLSATNGSAIRNSVANIDQTNNSTSYFNDSFSTLVGLKSSVRTSSTSVTLYTGDTTKNGAITKSAGIIPNLDFYTLGRNLNGVASNLNTSSVGIFYAGGDVSANITQLNDSFNAYLAAL